MPEVSPKIDNCMDCPHHVVVPDPDPNDWFCDDDEAVLCRLTKSEGEHPDGRAQAPAAGGANWPRRTVTVSCRPYQKRELCKVPDWCPLIQSSGGKA